MEIVSKKLKVERREEIILFAVESGLYKPKFAYY
jgi:hypothetical protein